MESGLLQKVGTEIWIIRQDGGIIGVERQELVQSDNGEDEASESRSVHKLEDV